jgi:hypothetical protein
MAWRYEEDEALPLLDAAAAERRADGEVPASYEQTVRGAPSTSAPSVQPLDSPW